MFCGTTSILTLLSSATLLSMKIFPTSAAVSCSDNNPFKGLCGRFEKSPNHRRHRRIVGGEVVQPGEVPWQAKLKNCGAVIVDERHLITAGHCHPSVGDSVSAGRLNGFGVSDFECAEQRSNIARVQTHPCFCPDKLCDAEKGIILNHFDIAVLTVDKPFTFNQYVRPVCLPKPGDEKLYGAGKAVTMVSGYGQITEETVAKKLRSVKVPIVPLNRCRPELGVVMEKLVKIYLLEDSKCDENCRRKKIIEVVGRRDLFCDDACRVKVGQFLKVLDAKCSAECALLVDVNATECVRTCRIRMIGNIIVNNDTICAGVPDGGVGTCWGDSGGPLVLLDDDETFATLIGVVSWSFGCSRPRQPGAYAEVVKSLDWIRAALKDLDNHAIDRPIVEAGRFNQSACSLYLRKREISKKCIDSSCNQGIQMTIDRVFIWLLPILPLYYLHLPGV